MGDSTPPGAEDVSSEDAGPPDPVPEEGSPAEEGVTVTAPSVVAVLVSHDPGDWLEPALEALGAQDYPDLTVLVLDAGSAEDPTARVAEVVPSAFVRRLGGDTGFAAAANEALPLVEGAAFFLVCHDDVTLEPDAVRLMVEEAYRSNAAIVGPKLVDDADPRVLLEVGMAIDRFGAPHSDIEAGELDHEQHDAVRDVFYVSSAAMLVRVDLFAELGGFDPAAYPGSEDLDLCWRARIAGARVMVAPDAKARHRLAATERGVDDVPTEDQLERSRLRSVLVSYSRLSLTWMIPWTIVHSIVESIVFVVARRTDRLAAVWKAWFWNLGRWKELRGARARAQALRRVPDRELRPLMVRGSARARRFLIRRVRAEETISLIGDTGRAVASRAQTGARQPIFLGFALAVAVYAIGSRELFFDGVPQVGQFADWPSVSELAAAFASGWRETMLGSPTPAPPVLGLMAVVAAALLGATGLAQTLVVLACVPVGTVGVVRLVRSISGEWVSAAAGGLAYLLLPVWRNAIANGRLGPLLLVALAPFVVHLVLAAAGAHADGTVGRSQLGRRWLALAVLGALVSAVYPPGLLLGLAVAATFALSAPLVGGLELAGRSVIASAIAVLGAAVLLAPWSIGMALGSVDAGAVGFGFRPRLGLDEIVRMSSGPAGARWSAIGLLLGALLTLAIARGPRLVWGVRAWALALVGFLLTWLPARFAPELTVPAPEATLAVFALGVATAVGLGVAAFIEDLRGQHFGWRQGVSLAAFVAIVLASLGILGDSVTGRWHAPARDWPNALAFVSDEEEGSFRVLWIGDPAVLPFEPVVDTAGLGYVLTVDGAGDATDSLRAPATEADDHLGDAVALAREGRTARLGGILAPMAVRYVIVPERVGPRAGMRARPPAELVTGLDDQVDLAKLAQVEDDLHLYENTAWIPMEALIAELPEGDAERADLVDLVVSTDADTEPDAQAGDEEGDAGVVLWSQAANDGWKATVDGETTTRLETFGWANGFSLEDLGEVEITWQRQWLRNLTVVAQVLGLAVLVGLWWVRRGRPVS